MGEHSQYSLSYTKIDVILVLSIRKTRFIHEIGADLVLPQVGYNLQSVLQVARLIGDNIHVASSWTPETEGTLFLDKRLNGRALKRCQSYSDFLHGNLNADSTHRVGFRLWGSVTGYQVIVAGKYITVSGN